MYLVNDLELKFSDVSILIASEWELVIDKIGAEEGIGEVDLFISLWGKFWFVSGKALLLLANRGLCGLMWFWAKFLFFPAPMNELIFGLLKAINNINYIP
jgi:hypothetical protein